MKYRDAVLALTPAAYWRFGEASGTVAVDEMGAINGTYISAPTLGVPGLLTGDNDTAVKFGAYSRMGITLPGYPVWTLAMLAKAESDGASDEDVLFRVNDFSLYITRVSATGLVKFYSGGAWTSTAIVSGATTPAHLVFTYDGTDLLAYASGVPAHAPVTGAGGALSADTAWFGTTATAYDRSQTIDEAAIWGRALTAAEIAGLYAIGHNGPIPSVAALPLPAALNRGAIPAAPIGPTGQQAVNAGWKAAQRRVTPWKR